MCACQNVEKVRAAAYDACNRLGKYRMPFAWTAIWMQNIVKGRDGGGGGGGGSDGSDTESTASNSLDRKSSTASFEQFRRQQEQQKGGGAGAASLTRKGSLERKDNRYAVVVRAYRTTLRRK